MFSNNVYIIRGSMRIIEAVFQQRKKNLIFITNFYENKLVTKYVVNIEIESESEAKNFLNSVGLDKIPLKIMQEE